MTKEDLNYISSAIGTQYPSREYYTVEKFNKFCKEYEQLKYYLTRGGFVQDRNGRWCKEGDRIKAVFNKEEPFELEIVYDYLNFGVIRPRLGECRNSKEKCFYSLQYINENGGYFELIEPCKLDVCKDFSEVENEQH